MISPILSLGISLALGQVPEPIQSMAAKLSGPILRGQYQRVGVIPCFIQREGEIETWGEAMGSQGEWLAEVFVEALKDEARERYQVADGRTMAKAFSTLRMTPAALADRETLKALAREAGELDALIVGRVVDVREGAKPGASAGRLVRSDITSNLIDLRNGELAGSAYRGLTISPTLAAYRGESLETGAFSPLAIDLPGLDAKGVNTPNLSSPPHEAANPAAPGPGPSPAKVTIPVVDDPRYPFPVQIRVDNTSRKLYKVLDPKTGRGELYVNLEPGEAYEIAVQNKTERTVYCVVYVDGINILGVRRDPDNPRFWNMAPGQDCRFRAWYVGSAGNYKEILLKVGRADDSIAIQKGSMKDGFADRIGEIQCIFFGTEGELKSEAGAKSMMLGKLGTLGGDARDITIPEVRGPKRSERQMLSFVIHYAPLSQIEQRQIVKD